MEHQNIHYSEIYVHCLLHPSYMFRYYLAVFREFTPNFLKAYNNKTGQNKHIYIRCTVYLYGVTSQERLMSTFNNAANCLLPNSQCIQHSSQ